MAKFDNHVVFRVLLIVLAAFVLFALINYYNTKQTAAKTERFYEEGPSMEMPPLAPNSMPERERKTVSFTEPFSEPESVEAGSSVKPSEENGEEVYRAVDFDTQKLPGDCFPKDRVTADDLLPKDAANSKWSQVATNGQGELANQNFLTAGYHVGINTISGSLRNANLQLRSEPPCPKMAVGPFNNSTILGDSFRRPLEIAGDC